MKYSKVLFFLLFIIAGSVASAQTIEKWKLQDLKAAIASAEQPTIFNFWATFCKPCIAEIPHFQELVKKYKVQGVKLVLVSLDLKEAYPAKIKNFAQKRSFTSPIAFLDETDADLFCPVVDSSWSGAIPASLFINQKAGYRKFFEEELSKTKVEEEIRKMIEPKS